MYSTFWVIFLYQLKYNDNFDGIVDCIVYYNYINDIPNSILSFIKRCSNSQLFECKKVFYCGKCFNKTTFGLYCSRCNIVHKKLECNITIVNDIFNNSSSKNVYIKPYVKKEENQKYFTSNKKKEIISPECIALKRRRKFGDKIYKKMMQKVYPAEYKISITLNLLTIF